MGHTVLVDHLNRMVGRTAGFRLRNRRELALYVARTTAICVTAALAFDVVNQLTFFEGWATAIRSWVITVAVVMIIAIPVARSIGKAHLALYEASRTDALTGLLNRRALLEGIDETPNFMALIIVDLDKFKQINDTHGHLAGDDVLRSVSHMMAKCLGDLGLVGRLGGEEFAIVASRGDLDDIALRLEGFRARVASTAIVAGSVAVSVTVSAGLARRAAGQSFQQLYALADQALYAAKAAGRNRIVLADTVEGMNIDREQAATAERRAS